MSNYILTFFIMDKTPHFNAYIYINREYQCCIEICTRVSNRSIDIDQLQRYKIKGARNVQQWPQAVGSIVPPGEVLVRFVILTQPEAESIDSKGKETRHLFTKWAGLLPGLTKSRGCVIWVMLSLLYAIWQAISVILRSNVKILIHVPLVGDFKWRV